MRLALGAQEHARGVTAKWRTLGFELGLGIGIAQGYATIGAIGFKGRWDHGAVGTVTNLAFRLCSEAQAGQTVVTRRVLAAVENFTASEPLGDLSLHGFGKPIPAYSLRPR